MYKNYDYRYGTTSNLTLFRFFFVIRFTSIKQTVQIKNQGIEKADFESNQSERWRKIKKLGTKKKWLKEKKPKKKPIFFFRNDFST